MTDIRISGGEFTDTGFTLEAVTPPITWNVTRLQRDADAGKFGPSRSIPMDRTRGPDWSRGNLSRATVDYIKAHPDILNKPGLVIASPPGSPYPYLCFCDGQHRGTARWELGLPDVSFFVVPAEVEKNYRVTVEQFVDGQWRTLT